MYIVVKLFQGRLKQSSTQNREWLRKNTLVFFEEDIGEKLFSNDIYHICNFTRNDFRGKKGPNRESEI